MKSYTLIILLFLSCYTYAKEFIWHEPKADFRIRLKVEDEQSSLFLDQWLLPKVLDNNLSAFDTQGEKLELNIDKSRRSLIFKSKDISRDVFIYDSGDAIVESPKDAYNMFTMELVRVWRVAGNAKEYLNMYKQNELRNAKREYHRIEPDMRKECLQSFIAPVICGAPMVNGWWELKDYGVTLLSDEYSENLYKCRHYSSGARWRRFNIAPLRAFWPDTNRYKNRIWNSVNRYINRCEKAQKNWLVKRDEDHDKILFANMLKMYNTRKKHSCEVSYPMKLQLITREHDLGGNMVIRYTGNLFVEQDQSYEFEVNTNSLWQFEIGDILKEKQMADENRNKPKSYNFKVDLKRGLYPLSFYYLRGGSPLDMAIRVKKGEDTWQILSEEMFSSAFKAIPTAIENKDGGHFPVIKRHNMGVFMTGKESYMQLNQLEYPQGVKLIENGQDLPLSSMVALKRESSISGEHDISLSYQGGEFALPKVKTRDKPSQIRGAVSFEIIAPATVYEDEDMALKVSIRNNYPCDLSLYMSVNGEVFPIRVASGYSEQNLPFREDAVLDVELWLPGFSFGKKGIRFLRANQLSKGLKVDFDELKEQESDRKICVVLERLTIASLRKWQLPRLVFSSIGSRVLVIGSSPQIIDCIKSQWGGEHIDEFFWRQEMVNGESILIANLLDLSQKLNINGSNIVVLAPPLNDIDILGKLKFFRYLSIVADMIRASSTIEKVYIIDNKKLYNWSREYGFDIIPNP